VPSLGIDRIERRGTEDRNGHAFRGLGLAGMESLLIFGELRRIVQRVGHGGQDGHGPGGLAQEVGEVGVLGTELGIRLAIGEESHHVGRVHEEMAATGAAPLHLRLRELRAFGERDSLGIIPGKVQDPEETARGVADHGPADELGGEARLGYETMAPGVVTERFEHQTVPPWILSTSGLA
jgi:hypothetical protein